MASVPTSPTKKRQRCDEDDCGRLTEDPCGICFDDITVRGKLDCCRHLFCFPCIMRWSKTENSCPHCKATFNTVTEIQETESASKKRVLRSVVIPRKSQADAARARRRRARLANSSSLFRALATFGSVMAAHRPSSMSVLRDVFMASLRESGPEFGGTTPDSSPSTTTAVEESFESSGSPPTTTSAVGSSSDNPIALDAGDDISTVAPDPRWAALDARRIAARRMSAAAPAPAPAPRRPGNISRPIAAALASLPSEALRPPAAMRPQTSAAVEPPFFTATPPTFSGDEAASPFTGCPTPAAATSVPFLPCTQSSGTPPPVTSTNDRVESLRVLLTALSQTPPAIDIFETPRR